MLRLPSADRTANAASLPLGRRRQSMRKRAVSTPCLVAMSRAPLRFAEVALRVLKGVVCLLSALPGPRDWHAAPPFKVSTSPSRTKKRHGTAHFSPDIRQDLASCVLSGRRRLDGGLRRKRIRWCPECTSSAPARTHRGLLQPAGQDRPPDVAYRGRCVKDWRERRFT